MKESNVDDLTPLAKDIERVFLNHFGWMRGGKPAIAIAFTLPPNYTDVHWVTNVSRVDGIELFQETANKMRLDNSKHN